MDSFTRLGQYDLAVIGTTFTKWYFDGYLSSVTGRAFDVGGATMSACHGIERGKLKNGSEESQGNGSIMRFAPSYLIAQHEDDPQKVMHEISDLTHSSKRVRETIDKFAAVLDAHLAGTRTTLGPGKELDRAEVNNSGWAVSTLEAALWAFNTTNTFEDGMIAAVNLGGDSDSIGAVFGQLAGAFYGFDAIPERWVKAVKDWEKVEAMIERFLECVG